MSLKLVCRLHWLPPEGKEKTYAYRGRKPFLFEGQSLIAIQEEQRKEIYTRVHLTPREILAIESYIFAIQHNVEIDKYVVQALHAPKRSIVNETLFLIRRRLANPQLYEPKKRGGKPSQHRETGNPKRNGNMNLPNLSTQRSHNINPQSDGLKF